MLQKLRPILKSAEKAPPQLKCEIYWAIADKIIEILNEYGMSDEELEMFVIDHLELIPQYINENKTEKVFKQEIILKLLEHYLKDNCGITDYVGEAMFALCKEKSDYKYST